LYFSVDSSDCAEMVRRSRLVDEDGVDLVDDRVNAAVAGRNGEVERHVVAQVVERQLGVVA